MTRSEIGNLYDPCELGTLRDRVKELGFKILGNDNSGWVDKATKRQLHAEIAWILQAKAPVQANNEDLDYPRPPQKKPFVAKGKRKAKAENPELVAA